MTTPLIAELERLGAPRSTIRRLNAPAPSNMGYLDLMHGVSVSWDGQHRIKPSAVVEFERKPILYVVDASSLATGPDEHRMEIAALRAKLATRGDAAWMAVRAPGKLTVYSLGFGATLPEGVVVQHKAGDSNTFIQDLALKGWDALHPGKRRAREAAQKAFHDVLMELVRAASKQMLASPALKNCEADVLSLVGRALFARFLVDRGFMTKATFPAFKGDFVSCFDDARRAAMTCRWLDDTFNGELLPLTKEEDRKNYRAFFSKLVAVDGDVLEPLSRILYHAPGGQLSIPEAWGGIDFAHVPAGLLSEVYEQFAHEHGPKVDKASSTKLAKAESIHYTPRAIAEFMLDQTFDAIRTCPKHKAHVLDPAAGGGVFLVLAYRRLVAAEWRARGRPNRTRLRKILYEQIRGFDINASALKLAALSLYLTALELDPEIENIKGIGFDPMIGHILTLARADHEPHPNAFVLGSLGPTIPQEHDHAYDLVIGNPPWTAWKGLKAETLNKTASDIVDRIADALPSTLAETPTLRASLKGYKNPDSRPDLAFAWRAKEWAKDNGVIAFALHARLLFNREGPTAEARNALFSVLKVTGILNGSALRQTDVWPGVASPWCLLFARNQIPQATDAFYFVSPQVESGLNKRGVMRVDYASAEPIEFGVLAKQPGLPKILFRGTELDADLMARLGRRRLPTLGSYWNDAGLSGGEGYKVAGDNPKPAPWMQGWPNLRKPRGSRKSLGFKIDPGKLPALNQPRLERARDPEIYAPPVLILPVSVQYNRDKGVGLIGWKRIAYSESFFGYSTARYSGGNAKDLAHYLHVLTASSLFIYHALMTSAQFGVERDTLQKEDADSFPIVPLDSLNPKQIEAVRKLSADIESGRCPWAEVDTCVAEIYALNASDRKLITDTLSVSLTYSDRRGAAESPPTAAQVQAFATELELQLRPHFDMVNAPIRVAPVVGKDSAWSFVDVTCDQRAPTPWLHDWLVALGQRSGSTQIFAEVGPQHLGLAMLSQYRYWTPSRARRCARAIISEHSNHLLRDVEDDL